MTALVPSKHCRNIKRSLAKHHQNKRVLLGICTSMVCAEAREAAVAEAVSLPEPKVPSTHSGCRYQLFYHSQAQHLPGKWTGGSCCA